MKKKNKLKQNAIANQKKRKLHDGKLKGKNNKLKQNAVTEEKKKKTHEIALWGFYEENTRDKKKAKEQNASTWKVLRRKENESKLKWKKNKLN